MKDHDESNSGKKTIAFIQKRNDSIVPFDIGKISAAVLKAMIASKEGTLEEAASIAQSVHTSLLKMTKKHRDFVPNVEGIQDTVEKELFIEGFPATAKAYALYRKERAEIRARGITGPPEVRKLAEDSKKYFRNSLGEFVYYRTYSRWIDAEG